MKYIIFGLFSIIYFNINAQNNEQRIPDGVIKSTYFKRTTEAHAVISPRIDPPNWFVGMHDNIVELMIHDDSIAAMLPEINYPGIKIIEFTPVANPNYLFVTIEIDPGTKAGDFTIKLKENNHFKTYPYHISPKPTPKKSINKWSPAEVIYLILPDRFSNGDTKNDIVKEYAQNQIDRNKMYYRHGGDLEGISTHIDYLTDLGITALWLNPVIENDQPYESYHGYAFTDHYAVDKRLGSLEEYKTLVSKLNMNGIKMIQDMVYNHVGDHHWFLKDLPEVDWIHQVSDTFVRTNYRDPVLIDPHVSKYDKIKEQDGWFDYHMPDLNQKNPRLARYLIQNSLWWIAETGIDGYRIDTYAYPDQLFMANLVKAILTEFPDFPIFGETWVTDPVFQAHFAQNTNIKTGFDTQLPAVTDFQLCYALKDIFKEQTWTEGASKLYLALAQDGLYKDANQNITFLDNHDKSRYLSEVGGDVRKLKSAITLLLTLRGIPCIYYGTEILLSGMSDPDGKVRQDFPGGWAMDSVNKFLPEGRNASENEMYNFIKKLIKYRSENPALYQGTLTHFIPENGIYAFFRQDEHKKIMVICNTQDKEQTMSLNKYGEFVYNGIKVKDIINDEMFMLQSSLKLEALQTLILEIEQ